MNSYKLLDRGANSHGPQGPPGTCPATCEPPAVQPTIIQGPPGEQGPPGVCSLEQCKEVAIAGPPGPPGQRGEKGDPGYCDLKDEQNQQTIVHMIREYLSRPEVQVQFKEQLADAEKCQCPRDQPLTTPTEVSAPRVGEINGFGAMVFEKENDLRKISHTLPTGAMVFVKEHDMFYLKTNEEANRWRILSMPPTAESVTLPIPKPEPKKTHVPRHYPQLAGKTLYLVARNERLRGDLRQSDHLTGAHSGSIYACQRSATKIGLGRAFYPLISTDVFNMDYVVPPMYRYNVPLVNVNGEVIFDDFMSLIQGRGAPKAKILTFDGQDVMDDPAAPCLWIGRRPIYLNGDYEYAAQAKCRNWQSTQPTERALAVSVPMKNGDAGLLAKENSYLVPCSSYCRMLCIQLAPTDA
ncbi:hypothetical protein T265_06392 [Opisthorchis viverrini]|uniref:Collagenase NC10/endostatin domain-containing protein n=1 Tax=Opisthorchis viverrini TaxID=6198 RepID=A0A074ZGC9_OPIVI|nr:hypothetical protein T265_06392 [Opisthorchis viverrini]KER26346.1 hypothetical protein T265_06392 [Opisthorchis viverrini]